MRQIVAFALTFCATPALAQYNPTAAVSVPMEDVEVTERKADGTTVKKRVRRKVRSDNFGNAKGTNYDLAIDGAFEGQTITVLQFYTGGGFDFNLPKRALAQKGFSVYRFSNRAPSIKQLKEALDKSNQLWIISGDQQFLNKDHLEVIRRFFEAGHGLYIWGDNPPYTKDANFVSAALFDATMDAQSYVQAQKVISLQEKNGFPGFLPNHLLTTGLEFLYEGHTIPALKHAADLKPLIVGSDSILVAAYYDRDGKRAIVDTGFTRLYINWDTAGTGRYVRNAAAWLANVERFGVPKNTN